MKQKGRELHVCHNNLPLNSQVGANPKFTRSSPLNNEALRHVSQNSLEHSGPLNYRVVGFFFFSFRVPPPEVALLEAQWSDIYGSSILFSKRNN